MNDSIIKLNILDEDENKIIMKGGDTPPPDLKPISEDPITELANIILYIRYDIPKHFNDHTHQINVSKSIKSINVKLSERINNIRFPILIKILFGTRIYQVTGDKNLLNDTKKKIEKFKKGLYYLLDNYNSSKLKTQSQLSKKIINFIKYSIYCIHLIEVIAKYLLKEYKPDTTSSYTHKKTYKNV